MSVPEAVRFIIDQSIRFISPIAVATEWALAAIAAFLIAVGPFGSGNRLRAVRNAFHRLAKHKSAVILLGAILPIAIRLSMLGFVPVPEPSIHDEFSHLLLADTLAHGLLTNPTHPMWMHFESIHIIQRPTYNSMYPPAQGSFLALGQVLFHEPWAGVMISVGIMCAAICWMMQAWLPPAWALFGTVLVILKIGIAGFWMNSYMGGAVPAIGGALLIGAVPRLRSQKSRAIDAFLLGIGLVILMNSRPFEGAVLGCAALLYLLAGLARTFSRDRKRVLTNLLFPAGVTVACGIIFTGYYSWKVTGSPVRMPYQVNRDTYGWPENLAFLPQKQLVLRHKVLQDMYVMELHNRDIYTSIDRLINSLDIRLFDNWTFFIGPILTIPLVFLPWVVRDRKTRALVVFLSIIAALNLFQMVLFPYHLAPVVPIIFAVVTQAVRQMYVMLSKSSRQRGCYFALVLPVSLIVIGAIKQEAEGLYIPLAYWEHAAEGHRDTRAYIQSWLRARSRKQLVLVRYAPDHSPNQEWVYNNADIDHSKVVWAREMDKTSNARLIGYFPDREAWLLSVDVPPQHLVRYREN